VTKVRRGAIGGTDGDLGKSDSRHPCLICSLLLLLLLDEVEVGQLKDANMAILCAEVFTESSELRPTTRLGCLAVWLLCRCSTGVQIPSSPSPSPVNLIHPFVPTPTLATPLTVATPS